jgi:hypothetical protein
MESCSKHIYIKPSIKSNFKGEAPDIIKEEDWEVHSDDLNKSIDSEDDEEEIKTVDGEAVISNKKPLAAMKKPKVAKERVNRQGRKFKAEVDTNIMSIALKVLKEDAELASGDPIFCQKCNGVFNMYSKLTKPEVAEGEMDADSQIWNCEFCQHKNEVVIDENEIPTKNSLNYVLENEESGVEEVKVKEKNNEAPIIFCIDISGSMAHNRGDPNS